MHSIKADSLASFFLLYFFGSESNLNFNSNSKRSDYCVSNGFLNTRFFLYMVTSTHHLLFYTFTTASASTLSRDAQSFNFKRKLFQLNCDENDPTRCCVKTTSNPATAHCLQFNPNALKDEKK
jgi:hypothetical protein